MYAHPQQGQSSDEVARLRQEAGRWLKARREEMGLSQRQLAQAVGVEYYTFISQIESGRGRVPPTAYEAWAKALKLDAQVLVRELLRFYDPITFAILFPNAARAAG